MGGVLAIDPGTDKSAWLVMRDGVVSLHGIDTNEDILQRLRLLGDFPDHDFAVVIERIESYGMAVGREVFDTVMWVGRFIEACDPTPVELMPRREVKLALCGSARAKDANIRAALMDRFGGAGAKGTKKNPGPLYGVSADVWSALAVAVTFTARKEVA